MLFVILVVIATYVRKYFYDKIYLKIWVII